MDGYLAAIVALIVTTRFVNCQQETYTYTDDCMKLAFKVSADITYPQTNGSSETVLVKGYNFSDDVLTPCQGGQASIQIDWEAYIFSLDFLIPGNGNTWELSTIEFEYITSDNPDFDNPSIDGDTLETNVTGINNISLGNSYSCEDGVSFNLTSDRSVVILRLSDLKLQAFNFTKHREFGKAVTCSVIPRPFDQVIYNDQNHSCIHVRIQLNSILITYKNTSGGSNTATIKGSEFSIANHFCQMQGNSRTANVTISWPSTPSYNLSVLFSANYKRGSQGWEIDGIVFQYHTKGNHDFVAPVEESATLSYSEEFTDNSISLTRSYSCDATDDYKFKAKKSNSSAKLKFSVLQLQAFQFSNPKSGKFGSAVKCNAVATPTIVPIIVGSALGVFVIALLIAYVLGRLRQWSKKSSGYQRL